METTQEKSNGKLREEALDILKGNWGPAIGTYLVFMITTVVVQSIPLVGGLASLILTGPLSLGIIIYTLKFSRQQDYKLEQIFDGFKDFTRALVAYLLMALYVFLWSLLLLFPGIMVALSYSMVFFVLADEPELSYSEALEKSKRMMYGYRWKYFLMNLVFVFFAILAAFTLFIGFLWLVPFIYVSYAKFYENIKAIYAEKEANGEAGPVPFF